MRKWHIDSKYGAIKSPLGGPDCARFPGLSYKTGVDFHHNLLQWQIVFLDRFNVN